ncbi:sensor histidine kinase [Phytohabitans kaempferiae]|uniref:histidine kinase n=1 Tax=Phytohabitans kaempferiae TaxID=1620943 RepID=A0ABV6MF71_9ACTN
MERDVWQYVRRAVRICVHGMVLAVTAWLSIPLLVVTIVSIALIPVGVGALAAPAALLAVRGLANQQRRWAEEWSGIAIATPYRVRPGEADPGSTGLPHHYRWLFGDPATWRDLLWLAINIPIGALLGLLPVALIVDGVAGVFLSPMVLLLSSTDRLFWALALPGGAALALLGVATGPQILQAHAVFSRSLLAPSGHAPTARVDQLAEARSQAAEPRRIESDLVRGIHPPVLAEHGLEAAVRAVVLTLPVPVDLNVRLPGRLPLPVESAAYFAITEALANIVKHSAASHAWVELWHDDHALAMIVSDNGVGGADPAAGSGLRGVEQRLAAFDGMITVASPICGPTVVSMRLPCGLSSVKTSPFSG